MENTEKTATEIESSVSGISEGDSCLNQTEEFRIPQWVIGFVFVLACITAFGFVYFSRYYICFRDYRRAMASFQKNDLSSAEKYIENASLLVPDNIDIESYKYYVMAFRLYSENKLNDSLVLFKKYQEYYQDDKTVNSLIMYIEIANAFDEQDYTTMVDLSSQLYELNKDDPVCILQYASALACAYTISNEPEQLNKARDLISEAKSIGNSEENSDYIERIEHRIKTKKIISSDEYYQLKKDGNI